MRISISFILLLLAGSCAFIEKGVVVRQEPIDENYQKQQVTIRILRDKTPVPFVSVHFLKIDEEDGMLLVCGARIGSHIPHMAKWYHAAEVFVQDTKNRVASARLLGVVDPETDSSEWRANCVKTDAKKIDADEPRSTPMGIVGPKYM